MFVILLLFLTIAVILQGAITPLPLVLLCLLYVTIIMRQGIPVFFLAFVTGLLLDTFALRPIGETSIFFLLFTFLVLLYQRKYEINSYQFVLVASFLGSLLYLSIFNYPDIWSISGFNALLACIFFAFVRLLHSSPLLHHQTGLHYKQ